MEEDSGYTCTSLGIKKNQSSRTFVSVFGIPNQNRLVIIALQNCAKINILWLVGVQNRKWNESQIRKWLNQNNSLSFVLRAGQYECSSMLHQTH